MLKDKHSNATQTEKIDCEILENSKDIQMIKENLNDNAVNDHLKQLTITQNHLFDALEQNAQLRNDLKIAEKCIYQEIGENVSLASVLQRDDASSWCGRAKQISELQQQLNVLKKQLNISLSRKNSDICVNKTESRFRLEYDKTLKDISIANGTINEQTIKINSLKLRNKILVAEILDLKGKKLQYDEQRQLHIDQMNSVAVKLN